MAYRIYFPEEFVPNPDGTQCIDEIILGDKQKSISDFEKKLIEVSKEISKSGFSAKEFISIWRSKNQK